MISFSGYGLIIVLVDYFGGLFLLSKLSPYFLRRKNNSILHYCCFILLSRQSISFSQNIWTEKKLNIQYTNWDLSMLYLLSDLYFFPLLLCWVRVFFIRDRIEVYTNFSTDPVRLMFLGERYYPVRYAVNEYFYLTD